MVKLREIKYIAHEMTNDSTLKIAVKGFAVEGAVLLHRATSRRKGKSGHNAQRIKFSGFTNRISLIAGNTHTKARLVVCTCE